MLCPRAERCATLTFFPTPPPTPHMLCPRATGVGGGIGGVVPLLREETFHQRLRHGVGGAAGEVPCHAVESSLSLSSLELSDAKVYEP